PHIPPLFAYTTLFRSGPPKQSGKSAEPKQPQRGRFGYRNVSPGDKLEVVRITAEDVPKDDTVGHVHRAIRVQENAPGNPGSTTRSEEHTSELQSPDHL